METGWIPDRWIRYGYVLAPLSAAALWGGLYVVSKWGFDAIPPMTLAFSRIAIGAIALLVVVRLWYPRRSFSRGDQFGFGILGVVVALSIVTQFLGTALTTASQGSLVTVLTPIFTVALGVSLLGERLTRRLLVGIALATIGTIVIVVGQYDASSFTGGAIAGLLALLVASATWALYTVWGKPLVERYSALETATYSCLVAVPVTAAFVPVEFALTDATLTDVTPTPALFGAVFYLGIGGTAAAWYLWYKGLEVVDASVLAAFFFAQPIVGALLGVSLLGESLGSLFIVGGVVLSVGVYLASSSGAPRDEPDTNSPATASDDVSLDDSDSLPPSDDLDDHHLTDGSDETSASSNRSPSDCRFGTNESTRRPTDDRPASSGSPHAADD